MSIECHDSNCEKHSCHHDPDSGPFCDEAVCIKTFKPCTCGADINESFRIQVLWHGGREDVAVAFCSHCKRVAPFIINAPYNQVEVNQQSREAWNNK